MDLSTGENKPQSEALISNQPGWFLTIIGILFSLFVGFLFRASFSPGFVKEKILQASLKINDQVITHVDSAKIKLKDDSFGILPRFSIVLEQVTMESNQPCWMMPLLQIDELSLPLSIESFLLYGKIEIKEMNARYVTLKLRSEKKCVNVASNSVNSNSSINKEVTLGVNLDQSKKNENDKNINGLQSFSAENFKIIYLPNRQNDLEFSHFHVDVLSQLPRKAKLQAEWNAFGDQRVGDYLFKSQLNFIFDESEDSIFSGNIKGQWREGSVAINVKHFKSNENTILSWNIHQVPMQQIMSTLNQYKLTQMKFNFKNFWFSSEGGSQIVNGKLNSFKFDKLILDGDIGNIQSGPVRGLSVDPLRFNEFDFLLKNMNLDFFMDSLKQDTQFVLSLGHLNGSATVQDRKNLKLTGKWTDLKFIFSNKGKRELQNVSSIDLICELTNNIWKINLDHFVLDKNPIDGFVKFQADRFLKKVDMNLNLKKIKLNPEVTDLMTNGGSIDAFDVESHLSLKDKQISKLDGKISFPNLELEDIQFKNILFNMKSSNNELHFSLRADRIESAINNPAISLAQPLLTQMHVIDDIHLKNIRGDFIYFNKSLEWKKVKMEGQKANYFLDGSWNDSGLLQGTIQTSGVSRMLWKLEGNRNEPQFIKIH